MIGKKASKACRRLSCNSAIKLKSKRNKNSMKSNSANSIRVNSRRCPGEDSGIGDRQCLAILAFPNCL